MFLKQIADPALAQYSYLIGCQRTGEAVVVDPERDIDRYLEIAKQEGLKITAVAETHIHADFVSGAREFATTDASIKLYLSAEGGPDWQSEWAKALPGYHPLHDGDSFKIGNIELQAIHTPGHTPEHVVFLVTDHGGGANEPIAMLSGDFLFVGDAGRPDLLEQAAGLEGTQEQGARSLYQSLRKVSEVPCHVQVLPAHGAGSACGKALGSIANSTFGYEEKFNPALKMALNESEEKFVSFILSGQPEPPAYFSNMKRVNKVGPALLGELPAVHPMGLDQVAARLNEPGFVVLDTRPRSEFLKGHLRGSLFTPPEKFTDFAGSFLSPEQEIVILAEDASAGQDFLRQLVRIGFDHIVGFLPTSAMADASADVMTKFHTMDFSAVPALLGENGEAFVIDVRKATEFAGAHIRKAHNLAHTRLRLHLNEIPKVPIVVHCQTGQRATGASAFLARNGYDVTCVADKFENAPSAILA